MYTQYFGLTEKPFAISPNPRYLFMSERHREALAHLLYGIESDGCIFLLTGDVGTGKTTICRCLLDQLPERTDVAIILNPKLTSRDLLRTACEELNLSPGSETVSIKTYIDTLNAHLLRSHAEGRVTALIIDEAQNLDINVLEQLRLLTNLETNNHKLLQIFLIGQPELRDILNKKGLAQINQRITGRYHLTPLEPGDVKAYIHHRLKVAGCIRANLFSERSIKHAVKLTRGIPRLINVLCDRALLGAYAENTDHVSLRIMKQAGQEVFPRTSKMFSFSSRELALGGALLITLAIAALALIPGQSKKTMPPEAAQSQHIETGKQIDSNSTPEKELDARQKQKALPPLAAHVTKPPQQPEQVSRPEKPDRVELALTPHLPTPTNEPEIAVVQETREPVKPNIIGQESSTPDHIPIKRQTEKEVAEVEAAEPEMNTIKISAPLIVLEQAGPDPEKKAMELILR